MCEIAIFDPDRTTPRIVSEVAIDLYRSQGDALGVVAVRSEDNYFDYEIYRATEPEEHEVFDFVEDLYDETYRFILHGRMATSGDRTVEEAHPIEIECEACDIDYVLHNGIVAQYEYERNQLERIGHEFSTDVDSENIAHRFQTISTELEELDNPYPREPCYILLSSNAILVTASARYHLTDDLRLSCSYRRYGPDRREGEYGRLLVTPTSGD